MSRTASLTGQELLQRRLPGQERPLGLVRLEPVEDVAADAKPGRAGEGALHCVAPDAHGKITAGLAVPRQVRDLESAVLPGEEHGAAEEQLQRDGAAVERVEVL